MVRSVLRVPSWLSKTSSSLNGRTFLRLIVSGACNWSGVNGIVIFSFNHGVPLQDFKSGLGPWFPGNVILLVDHPTENQGRFHPQLRDKLLEIDDDLAGIPFLDTEISLEGFDLL